MAEPSVTPAQDAHARYEQLVSDRWTYLNRARDAAKLTIPSMYPPSGSTSATKLPTPYQSFGARGVNNLSSKLLLTLFPPNTPFFRLEISDRDKEILAQGNPDAKSAVDTALSKVEREVQSEIESTAVRPSMGEGLKHLIMSGNVLVYMKPEGGVRIFHLGDYVCKRDTSGNVLEILTEERVSALSLPANVRAFAAKDKKDTDPKNNICLYTWIQRGPRHWTVHQEIKGMKVPGSDGNYPLDKSPWLPLRWSVVDGEDYGRGFVEEYQGDLQSLEGLTQAIVEGAVGSAKLLYLVNPNGVTKLKTIAEAPNGSVRAGKAEDVTAVQTQKGGDFSVAERVAAKIEERLSYAFMLNSAVQRSAERVTAEEIRYMAQELETSLGGLYSILSQEFQLPFVSRLMFQMERSKKLPNMPSNIVKPAVITGLEALGRGNDLQRLDLLVQPIEQIGAPGMVYLNMGEYFSRRATAIGIDPEGLIKTDQQVQQEQAAAQQQQSMSDARNAAIPGAVKAAGDVVNTRVAQSQAAPPAKGQ